MGSSRGLVAVALAVVALLAVAPSAAPQDRIPTGRLVEKVPCPSDPSQTYTLYLPSSYTTDRKWPLLFVFDPRGRGTLAAEIFRPAAERFGWIIASSNNTMSDGEWEPNRRAVSAMWPDVLAEYAVDEQRLYAAGFSGGASLAWVLAANGAPLAGIIAAGGPDLPNVRVPSGRLAWFGTAGRSDFNYLNVRETERRFAEGKAVTRLEHFDGVHRWLPPDLAMRAIAWLDTLANPTKDAVAAEDLAYAERLQKDEHLVDASRAFAVIHRDYAGTPAARTAESRIRVLDADPGLQRARREEKHHDGRERARLARVGTTLQTLYASGLPPSADLIRELEIPDLARAAAQGDYAAGSAQRTLEIIFVQTSFYIWRDFEARKMWPRVETSLEIAVAIHADRPRLWIDLAAARAMQRRTRQAFEALEKAVALGFRNADVLIKDERFARIRETPQFAAFLERLGR